MKERGRERRGARDAASLLFLPPIVHIFAGPLRPAGIPLVAIYVFAVWIALIAAAFLIARRLEQASAEDAIADEPEE